MSIVIDASTTLAWCFEDQDSPHARSVLERVRAEGGVVPEIWSSEIANGLLVAEKRKRIDVRDARMFCDFLRRLAIAHDTTQPSQTTIYEYARSLGLTAYDALYAELAERRNLPLATNDVALRNAAARAHIEII